MLKTNKFDLIRLAAMMFASALLRRSDLSYGVYLYHAPVLHCLLKIDIGGNTGLLIALVLTAALAYASWLWIENAPLGLKRHRLYQHGTVGTGS